MLAGRRCLDYIEKNCLRKDSVAKKLGMSCSHFSQFLNDTVPLPKKYWLQVIEFTEGEVSLADLLRQYLDVLDFVEVTSDYSKIRCEVSIKKSALTHKSIVK